MRTLERTLVVLALLATAGITTLVFSARRSAVPDRRTAEARDLFADSVFADSVLAIGGPQNPEIIFARSSRVAPDRDPARIAHMLATRSAGTYLGEMLAAHDSMNHRWPDRSVDPMRVWVQHLDEDTPGWDNGYPHLVRDAFSRWNTIGVPIHFTFVMDSARAEIHVTWTDRFEAQMTGRTRWAHDQHRWIVGGNILLALHLPDGRPLDRDAVRAIALHEVGHLIGLDHATDRAHIMSPRVHVSELSEADQRTARLVYSLPPGSLKGAPR
jgi:hypothetical protein